MSGTGQRSMGLPEANVPATYPSNDSGPKPPRVLPTSLASVFCELRGDRVVIGHKLGESQWAETSYSVAEFRSLVPQLRAVVAQTKETP